MSEVSVVVPVYNAGSKLDKCIKSILNQTFEDFELILINDGSTDNSLRKCMEYKEKDKRVIVIDKKNEGCFAARRKGVDISKSPYILFVDADDWIDNSAIEVLYMEAIKSDADVIVSNLYKVVGRTNFIRQINKSPYFNENKIYNEEKVKDTLVVAYFHGHPFPSSLCAKLYKRELLVNSEKYLNRIKFLGEDLYYNIEVFLKAKKVNVIKKSFYYYRTGGYTSKFMPYLFDDAISGYEIQKEVIDEFYLETKQKQYNGISIMLLNTLKTCLSNLFLSDHSEQDIKEIIGAYTSNICFREAIKNEGSKRYFPHDYLEAIEKKDIQYLYALGKVLHKQARPRRVIKRILTNII